MFRKKKKFDFTELDEFLEFYKATMPKKFLLVKNKPRYEEMEATTALITQILKDKEAEFTISTKPCTLLPSDCNTSIVTDSLTVDTMRQFCDTLSKADILDIYPAKVDGKQRLRIDISFNEVYKPYLPKSKRAVASFEGEGGKEIDLDKGGTDIEVGERVYCIVYNEEKSKFECVDSWVDEGNELDGLDNIDTLDTLDDLEGLDGLDGLEGTDFDDFD